MTLVCSNCGSAACAQGVRPCHDHYTAPLVDTSLTGDAQLLEHALDDALSAVLKARAGAAMYHLVSAVWLAVAAGSDVDRGRVNELLQQISEFGSGAFPSWQEAQR